jgi:hypothetical protein
VSVRRLALVLIAFGVVAFASGPANAERTQDGNLIVTLNGGVTPLKLPRHRPAPVAVHLAGHVMTSDSSPLPRVNWIRLELAWRGVLDTHGLPLCPRSRLIGANSTQALERCGDARVGSGRLFAKVFVPNQQPLALHAQLIAFNGQTKAGRPAVLVHSYSNHPPVSFVIPFTVHHKPGQFRTVLITTIRKSVGPWPHVANFRIDISRSFDRHGDRRSYLSASCPVPHGFTAGFLSFARATYTFEGGSQLTIESVRSCRAR